MLETEAKEVVQRFALEVTDPRLGESVGHGNLEERFDDLAVIGLIQSVEGGSELASGVQIVLP